MIVLRYVLEYTPGEIAELLELPRGTVNSRLRRGLDRAGEERRDAEERAWEAASAARLRGAGARRARQSSPAATSSRGATHAARVARCRRGRGRSRSAIASSPPGRAVLDSLREAIGIERAAAGAILAARRPEGCSSSRRRRRRGSSHADGSKRRLGDVRRRVVVAVRPLRRRSARATSSSRSSRTGRSDGSLARPASRFPRWGGTQTDTRIAYLAGSRLRVVAGDGTGDRLPLPARPAARVAARGRHVPDVPRRRRRWRPGRGRRPPSSGAREVRRVARVVEAPGRGSPSRRGHRVRLLDGGGRSLRTLRFRRTVLRRLVLRRGRTSFADAHLRAGGRRERDQRDPARRPRRGRRTRRTVRGGGGVFGDMAWAPNGRWLLVDWPSGRASGCSSRGSGRVRAR